MKLTTTFQLLKKAGACESGYKKLAKALGGVDKYGRNNPINLLQIMESNGVDDCLWALRATVEECDSLCRLLVADVAEEVLPLFEKERPGDDRPRKAIQAARAFARGEIGVVERDGAREAAREAARDAGWDAGWSDARAAVVVAAAGASAGAAAGSLTWAVISTVRGAGTAALTKDSLTNIVGKFLK